MNEVQTFSVTLQRAVLGRVVEESNVTITDVKGLTGEHPIWREAGTVLLKTLKPVAPFK